MSTTTAPGLEMTPALFAAQCLAAEHEQESRDLRAKRAGAALLAAVLAAPDAELPTAVREAKRAVEAEAER
jgi:phage terminase large subunit-like protein